MLRIGADESGRDEVAIAMDIVNDNSPILHQSSVDVEIPRNYPKAPLVGIWSLAEDVPQNTSFSGDVTDR